MKIGVPKEIVAHETRVAITPTIVKQFTKNGFQVLVEKNARAKDVASHEELRSALRIPVDLHEILKPQFLGPVHVREFSILGLMLRIKHR